MIEQAFIFAAGRGERMRPITDFIPKPLIKICEKSIIDYSISKLLEIGSIKNIVINGYYLSEKIRDHVLAYGNDKIVFSSESEKLETGGGLVFASNKIDLSKPILLINGDMLWFDEKDHKTDIESLCEKYCELNLNGASCDVLLGLKRGKEVVGYAGRGDFDLDPKTLTVSSQKKEREFLFVGLQIINPKILKKAPEKMFSMSFFYKEAEENKGIYLRAIELQSKYFHISTPADIELTENFLKNSDEIKVC